MKIQFNTKEAQAFKDTINKWHVAVNKSADAILSAAANTSEPRAEIHKAQSKIAECHAKMDGRVARTEADTDEALKDIIANMHEIIDTQKKLVDKYEKIRDDITTKFADDEAMGLAIVSTKMYLAYKKYAENLYTDEVSDCFAEEFALWLTNHGVQDATAENVDVYVRAFGLRNNARGKSRHTTILKEKEFKKIVLGAIVDYSPSGVFDDHKWEYIAIREAKKAANKAKKENN